MTTTAPSSLQSLVAAHVDLVYSAALRQVRDPHLADDVTQTVFLVLARKIHAAPPEPYLAPWLLKVTRYTALTALRASRRRTHHESKALPQPTESPADHEFQLTSLLDEALMSLAESDRILLICRYLQNQSVAEIATTQNLLPNTAAKKIQRALEKLRAHFTRRNITTTDAALSAFLPTTLLRAPQFLLPKILTASAALPAATSTSIGVFLMSTAAKLKIAAAVLFALFIVAILIPHFSAAPTAPTTPISNLPVPEQTHVRQLLYQLRYCMPIDDPEATFTAIHDLTNIGPPAVPELCAELDRTDRQASMFAIVFTLHAINDPRAVPALIRALIRDPVNIPLTGVSLDNPDLWEFVNDNRIDTKNPGKKPYIKIDANWYAISKTLEQLTSYSLGTTRAKFTTPETFKLRVQSDAAAWQDWFDQNKSTLLTDDQLNSLIPPPHTTDLIQSDGLTQSGYQFTFPTGPTIHLGPTHELLLPANDDTNKTSPASSINFDTGQTFPFPRSSDAHDIIHHLGINAVVQTSYPDQQSAQSQTDPFHYLLAYNIRSWQVDPKRWDTLDSELQNAKPLDLPNNDRTANFWSIDPALNHIASQINATFLFITPQGGHGIVQIVADSQNPPALKIRYRMLENSHPSQPTTAP